MTDLVKFRSYTDQGFDVDNRMQSVTYSSQILCGIQKCADRVEHPVGQCMRSHLWPFLGDVKNGLLKGSLPDLL